MIKYFTSVSLVVILFSGLCSGDVFKHRQSGEVFYGYPTNRTRAGKTRVYVENDGKFIGKTIKIDEYDVTYDIKGRKSNLVVIEINDQDILLSGTVSKLIANVIVEGANKGPRCILLEIDSPGGRGDCMKTICEAIKKASNCPVIAFISGQKYGGAFSAAAGIAIACDKIYIASDAEIGTIASQVNSSGIQPSVDDWQGTFLPDGIEAFGGYLSRLAEKKNRPGALARAFLDMDIEIAEVVIDECGLRNIIDKANKQSKDVIVKTWSKTKTVSISNDDLDKLGETEIQTVSQVTISADDAIYLRMADAIANSRSEVLEALKSKDAKLLVTTRIKTEVRKFAQSRDMANNYFANMIELEARAAEIETQIKGVVLEGRKNRPSKEDERLKRLQREMYQDRLKGARLAGREIRNRSAQKRARKSLSEKQIKDLQQGIDETYLDPYLIDQQRLTLELEYVLDDLLFCYVNAGDIVKRYPFALPEGKTFQYLQKRHNAALMKINALRVN